MTQAIARSITLAAVLDRSYRYVEFMTADRLPHSTTEKRPEEAA